MFEPLLPLLIEPEDLPQTLDQTLMRLVDMSSVDQYNCAHIPGAVHLPPARTTSTAPVPGFMPSHDQLEQVLGELGHHERLHYVVYDDEGGGWAGRFIWLLDSIGHKSYSYINGGIKAWIAAGLPTEQTPNSAPVTNPQLHIIDSPSISLDKLKESLNDENLVIWDARSPAEYRGDKVLANKGGHIPGAINFEWTAGMDPERGLRLRLDLAQQLEARGITPDKQIVTHCQTHHRSGFTYLAAKILGYPHVRAYPGSWSEWGNHPDTPVES